MAPALMAGRGDSKAAQPSSTAGRGILIVLFAWCMFACMDAGSKLLAEDYPIVQILWVRFVLLTVVAFWFARRSAGLAGLRTHHFGHQIARAVLLTVEIGLFINAITAMPIASAHAIFAITPLLITALAVPLLGERVGPRRWAAVGIAFVGVLVILRPGLGAVQPMSLVVLLCALMFALYQILTRMVSRNRSTRRHALLYRSGWGGWLNPHCPVLLGLARSSRFGAVSAGRGPWGNWPFPSDQGPSARARVRAPTVQLHDPTLGDAGRLPRVRQSARLLDRRWRRDHRWFGDLRLCSRAQSGVGAAPVLAHFRP